MRNERTELQVRLRNLTEERELLLEHLNSERDECQHRLSALTSERDLLSASYDKSRREAAAATMGRKLRELQANCSRLRATAERLHVDNADLQRRNVNLSASLERQKKSQAAAEAQSELSAARFRDRYESLRRDKEELNGSCQVLRREMQQLQRNYTLLAAARDHLQVQLENMKRGDAVVQVFVALFPRLRCLICVCFVAVRYVFSELSAGLEEVQQELLLFFHVEQKLGVEPAVLQVQGRRPGRREQPRGAGLAKRERERRGGVTLFFRANMFLLSYVSNFPTTFAPSV